MGEIKVFSIGAQYRDGGSIDSIHTNIGEFKLIKRLGNKDDKNGFYDNNGKVEEPRAEELSKALDKFFKEKRDKRKQQKLKEAVETLVDALKGDEDYKRSWTANIAMAFKDDYYWYKNNNDKEYLNNEDIHIIANTAAKNFINLLCKDATN